MPPQRPLRPRTGPDGKPEVNTALTTTPLDDVRPIPYNGKPVIPVILIPGIMATRLTDLESVPVWDPPPTNNYSKMLDAFFEYLFKGPKDRSKALDPDKTLVAGAEPGTRAFLQDRGIPGLYKDAYGKFIENMEKRLNALHETAPGSIASKYRYEFWGGGYNWLRSNRESSARVARVIDQVIEYYKSSNTLNKNGQVLIITHSMGGIVSRGLTNLAYNKKIMGVIHTVQPWEGAGPTYKRMRAGFEGAASVLLGRNALEVSAILAKSIAGLELLPTPRYNNGSPWLYCPEHLENRYYDQHAPLLTLPSGGDPYTEIYMSRKWYGLIPDHNAAIVNIAYNGTRRASPDETINFFDKFDTLINKVKKFHDDIMPSFHPFTYALWSDDGAFKTWGTVAWDYIIKHHEAYMNDPLPGMGGYRQRRYDDDHLGTITYQYISAEIKPPREAGDGTVPAAASAALCKAQKRKVFGSPQNEKVPDKSPREDTDATRGFDHSDCCNYQKVQDAVFEFAVEMINTKMG